jgi:hypothetical protein
MTWYDKQLGNFKTKYTIWLVYDVVNTIGRYYTGRFLNFCRGIKTKQFDIWNLINKRFIKRGKQITHR